MYACSLLLHTVSFSAIPDTPCMADVSNVSMELSRYNPKRSSVHCHGRCARRFPYVKGSKLLPILIEGVVVELGELL